MRKLTVGVLALGCLALLVGTLVVSLPQSVMAGGVPGVQLTYDQCFAIEQTINLCRDNKVMVCHFNEGAGGEARTGKAKCQEPGNGEGGYESHVGPLGHGTKDYCIESAAGVAICEETKIEDPK